MSNTSSQIVETSPAAAQTPAQPTPIDTELLKLISGGLKDDSTDGGPNNNW